MGITALLFLILFVNSKAVASGEAPPLYESVLFVGDDRVAGPFGNAVDRYLRTIAVDVNTVAVCGSTADTWIGVSSDYAPSSCGFWQRNEEGQESVSKEVKRRLIPEELAKANPDLTVIALGTYMLNNSREMENQRDAIGKILNEVEKVASKCIWIGPPRQKKDPFAANLGAGVKTLKDILKKRSCDFVDSSNLSTAEVIRSIEKLNRPSAKDVRELENVVPGSIGPPSQAPR
ncbi:hypothetical protein [Bdellovibrio sp. HCB288]|uniref:hypothetical protein n=1 Tax=Bdellovibrio sp. HCB288 TaxID=3394355 RepID=UPI0039B68546